MLSHGSQPEVTVKKPKLLSYAPHPANAEQSTGQSQSSQPDRVAGCAVEKVESTSS